MRATRMVRVVETHTAGMPTRIVLAGFPRVAGETMLDRVAYVRASEEMNNLRKMMLYEPRGHVGQFGALLVEPVTPGAVTGVIFFTPAGFNAGMCGHGTIGIATALAETGIVSGSLPLELILDTGRGPVQACVNGQDGIVESVAFRSLPSFLYESDRTLTVPGLGVIQADIAFGGNFYAFVRAQDVGARVGPEHLPALRKVGTAILRAAKEQVTIDSPAPWIHRPAVSAVIVRDKPVHPEAHQRNIMIGTSSYDRSPCGTGTSAWIAVLHASGQLALGEEFVHESIIGSLFRGVAAEEIKVGGFDAIIPEITGSAYITAFHDFVIAPRDPYRYGFKLISGQPPTTDPPRSAES